MEIKKIKKIDMSGLSAKEQKKMKEHSNHHSLGHIKYMIGIMRNGASFEKAHKIAQEKIGK